MSLKKLKRKATKAVKQTAAVSKVVVSAASKNPYIMSAANAATGGQAGKAVTLYNQANKLSSKVSKSVRAATPVTPLERGVQTATPSVTPLNMSISSPSESSQSGWSGIFGLGFLIF